MIFYELRLYVCILFFLLLTFGFVLWQQQIVGGWVNWGFAYIQSHVKANKSLKLEKQLSMEHGTKRGPEVLKYVCH